MRDRRAWAGEILVFLAFLGTVLIFFRGLLLPDKAFLNYDIVTYFYPYRHYAAEVIRQGGLPLWNPLIFLGAPLLANIQTAVLYPLSVVFYVMPTYLAVTVSIVLHVFLAGVFTYLFAKHTLRIGRFPSLITALIFMFGGFILVHLGHLNQLSVVVWLPLVLLLLDQTMKRRSLALAVATGSVIAVQILAGHTQEVYYSLVVATMFVAYVTFLETKGDRRKAYLLPALFALALVVAALVAAIQLLPTYELSGLSTRAGGMSFETATVLSLPPKDTVSSLLPDFVNPPTAEFTAYTGVAGLVLAFFALRRRRKRFALFFAGTASIAVLLAFGSYVPAARLIYTVVPGLNLLRVPARWLFIYSFSMACLAGLGVSSILGEADKEEGALSLLSLRRLGIGVSLAVLMLLAFRKPAMALVRYLQSLVSENSGTAAYLLKVGAHLMQVPPWNVSSWNILGWVAVFATASAILGLMITGRRGALAKGCLIVLVIAELFVAGRHMDFNYPTKAALYTSATPGATFLRGNLAGNRYMSIAKEQFSPQAEGKMLSRFGGFGSARDRERALENLRYKEVIRPNINMVFGLPTPDGYDGGVLPTRQYAEFTRLFATGRPDPFLTWRQQTDQSIDARLLGMLNVKYVLADAGRRVSVGEVEYLLQDALVLGPENRSVEIDYPNRFEADSIGLITFMGNAAEIPDKTGVARITLSAPGEVRTRSVRAGVETAEWAYDRADVRPRVKHARAKIALHSTEDETAHYYVTELSLGQPFSPQKIKLDYTYSSGQLYVFAFTLLRRQANESVTLDYSRPPGGKPVFDESVRIYLNPYYLPRAYTVHNARVIRNREAILKELKGRDFDPSKTVILEERPDGPVVSSNKPPEDKVAITEYRPERVVISAAMTKPGILVLSDAHYPGWKAFLDGKEVKTYRANYLLRAVTVPEGNHSVLFVFDPQSYRVGRAVSLASLFLFGGVLVGSLAISWRRRRR